MHCSIMSSNLHDVSFRWILKCHACYNVTAEIGKIFCPKCGNGGTLRKVAVTVGENGVVLASRKPRITLRGTKVVSLVVLSIRRIINFICKCAFSFYVQFSLPLPQGGRDAITKNLVLREDQLPQKFLHPKTKKKVNKQVISNPSCLTFIFNQSVVLVYL